MRERAARDARAARRPAAPGNARARLRSRDAAMRADRARRTRRPSSVAARADQRVRHARARPRSSARTDAVLERGVSSRSPAALGASAREPRRQPVANRPPARCRPTSGTAAIGRPPRSQRLEPDGILLGRDTIGRPAPRARSAMRVEVARREPMMIAKRHRAGDAPSPRARCRRRSARAARCRRRRTRATPAARPPSRGSAITCAAAPIARVTRNAVGTPSARADALGGRVVAGRDQHRVGGRARPSSGSRSRPAGSDAIRQIVLATPAAGRRRAPAQMLKPVVEQVHRGAEAALRRAGRRDSDRRRPAPATPGSARASISGSSPARSTSARARARRRDTTRRRRACARRA